MGSSSSLYSSSCFLGIKSPKKSLNPIVVVDEVGRWRWLGRRRGKGTQAGSPRNFQVYPRCGRSGRCPKVRITAVKEAPREGVGRENEFNLGRLEIEAHGRGRPALCFCFLSEALGTSRKLPSRRPSPRSSERKGGESRGNRQKEEEEGTDSSPRSTDERRSLSVDWMSSISWRKKNSSWEGRK